MRTASCYVFFDGNRHGNGHRRMELGSHGRAILILMEKDNGHRTRSNGVLAEPKHLNAHMLIMLTDPNKQPSTN